MALWKQQDEDEFFGEDGGEPRSPDRTQTPAALGDDTAVSLAIDDMALRESQATKEQFRNVAYFEAFETTKEEKLQTGFEEGYRQSFNIAIRIGEMLGQVTSESWVNQEQPSLDAQGPAPKISTCEKRAQGLRMVKRVRTVLDQVGSHGDSQMKCEDLLELEQDILLSLK